MAYRFNYERAAMALADAAFTSDEAAAKKHGLTPRSLCNYRRRLADDPKLSEAFREKKAILSAAWAEDLPAAIRACIAHIKAVASAAPSDSADMLRSMAGALKILTDVAVQERVLDARFSREAGQAGAASPAVASTGASGRLH